MNMMNEEDRGKAFPIHVEMGDDGPILDLGDRANAVNLPDSGCILVDYEKNEDGTLTVKTMCLPAEESEDEPDDLSGAMDMAMRKGEKKAAIPAKPADEYTEEEE